MKKCPYCAEEIQDEAVKCRHCGQALISQEMRELAGRWSWLSQRERDQRWADLSEREQRELSLAIEQVRPAPQPAAPQSATKRKTSPVAWGCLLVIVLGVIGAIANDSRSRSNRTDEIKMAPGAIKEPRLPPPVRVVPAEAARSLKESYNFEKGGNLDRNIPIGGGWVVTDVVPEGLRLVVKLRIPRDNAPTNRGIAGAVCPGPLEPVWSHLAATHQLVIEASNGASAVVVPCRR